MNISSPAAPPSQIADPAADIDADIERADGAEELLVEEVSIDGMCGVY
jgi:mycofactocin precursor